MMKMEIDLLDIKNNLKLKVRDLKVGDKFTVKFGGNGSIAHCEVVGNNGSDMVKCRMWYDSERIGHGMVWLVNGDWEVEELIG